MTESSSSPFTVDNSPPPTDVTITAPAARVPRSREQRPGQGHRDRRPLGRQGGAAVDGSVVATDTAAPYDLTWNTLDPLNQAFNGAHDLKVEAVDSSGRSTESALRTVTVSNNVVSGAAGPFKASVLPQRGRARPTTRRSSLPPMIETDRTFTTSTTEGSGTSGGTGTTGTKTGTPAELPVL